MLDVMPGLDLPVGLANLGEHPLLVGHVRFHRIADEEVGTPARNLGQPSQPPLDVRLQPDTEGGRPCVCHEHIVTYRATMRGAVLVYDGPMKRVEPLLDDQTDEFLTSLAEAYNGDKSEALREFVRAHSVTEDLLDEIEESNAEEFA